MRRGESEDLLINNCQRGVIDELSKTSGTLGEVKHPSKNNPMLNENRLASKAQLVVDSDNNVGPNENSNGGIEEWCGGKIEGCGKEEGPSKDKKARRKNKRKGMVQKH